jgi:hypothetical protein
MLCTRELTHHCTSCTTGSDDYSHSFHDECPWYSFGSTAYPSSCLRGPTADGIGQSEFDMSLGNRMPKPRYKHDFLNSFAVKKNLKFENKNKW